MWPGIGSPRRFSSSSSWMTFLQQGTCSYFLLRLISITMRCFFRSVATRSWNPGRGSVRTTAIWPSRERSSIQSCKRPSWRVSFLLLSIMMDDVYDITHLRTIKCIAFFMYCICSTWDPNSNFLTSSVIWCVGCITEGSTIEAVIINYFDGFVHVKGKEVSCTTV